MCTHTHTVHHMCRVNYSKKNKASLTCMLCELMLLLLLLISLHRIHNTYCLENLTPDLAVIAVALASINMLLCGALPKANYILASNYFLIVA